MPGYVIEIIIVGVHTIRKRRWLFTCELSVKKEANRAKRETVHIVDGLEQFKESRENVKN